MTVPQFGSVWVATALVLNPDDKRYGRGRLPRLAPGAGVLLPPSSRVTTFKDPARVSGERDAPALLDWDMPDWALPDWALPDWAKAAALSALRRRLRRPALGCAA
jgi:hypothetical protein